MRAIYILWLREMKRFWRSKSRILSSLIMPLMFLGFLGTGFKGISVGGGEYINFLSPGILGMLVLFSSTFAGITVLLDKEFGFLKEVMVAPVSRVSIALGRIAGGTTTTLIQTAIVLILSSFMGFSFNIYGIPLAFFSMILCSMVFISIGLIFASIIEQFEGFNVIVNFFIFPLFFLSGAVTPIENFPVFVQVLSYLSPLTYGIDIMRYSLTGYSLLPLYISFPVLLFFSIFFVLLAAKMFERSEVK